MPPPDLIDELMLRWEEARQRGEDVSPDALAAGAPALVSELRGRIRAILDMEQVLGVTTHDPRRTMLAPTGIIDNLAGPLPAIPGYELIRVIDQGGMGVVYEARQTELGRTVAIKMISSLHVRPKALARFRAEAEAAARLQHPNVVQIFEVGVADGRPFFSMEYLPGGSLADFLTRQRPSPRESAALIETLARAVHVAHQSGIVHRDLKPSNVLLQLPQSAICNLQSAIPKVSDFGLAKRLDDDFGHTHTGEVLGTPSYMAPEQAEGKKDQIGPATDVYALGAILYELLAGKPPFQGATPLESLRQVATQEPVAPSRCSATVPRDLEAICLKCLEKAPAQRYASAQALADDLRRFLDGQPVTAWRLGPVGRFWKLIRRHPQGAALGAALGALVFIPVFLFINEIRAQQEIRAKAVAQAPHVYEILKRNCFECHGQNPGKLKGKLDILNTAHLLDTARLIVVAGHPEDSLLIQRISDGSMPPEEEEVRLPRITQQELTILRDWILGGAPALPAQDPGVASVVPHSVSAAKAKAIFLQHCYDCHKFDKGDGGIRILHHRLLVSVRKVVVPGDPDASKLYKRLIHEDDELRMPLDAEPLSDEEIGAIRRWIEEGAAPFPKAE